MLLLQTKEDEELTGALDSLDVSLKENIQLLSSFEKYKKEVLGDSLDWTPMHTSQQVTPFILALISPSFHHSTATPSADWFVYTWPEKDCWMQRVFGKSALHALLCTWLLLSSDDDKCVWVRFSRSCEHFGACVLQFWKENVEKFEEKDFQILRVLLKLLEASRETRTLAVGCHDLGMFITNHPHGRSIVTGNVRSEQHVAYSGSVCTEPDDGFLGLICL